MTLSFGASTPGLGQLARVRVADGLRVRPTFRDAERREARMRRLLVLGVTVVLVIATTAGVVAKTDLVRQPTPEAVVAEHIDALNECDVDRLMAQYPDDIKILLPGGVTTAGRDDVRALFEGFCQPFPAGLAGLHFTELSSSKVHKTINAQWKAEACFLAEPYLGADAYETWSGLMAAQVTTFDGAELAINPDWRQDCGVELRFQTTAGPLGIDDIGNVLAHHHYFVELGDATPEDFLGSTPEEVYEALEPWLTEAKALGAGSFIEPTPFGVGRRPDIVKYVADQADLPTMMVTGIYREPFVTDDMPGWVYGASVEEIADFMRGELSGDPGVGGTGVPAGFIKLSQNDTGMTLTEKKILEAACLVAQETDATIASHITSGPAALAVIGIGPGTAATRAGQGSTRGRHQVRPEWRHGGGSTPGLQGPQGHDIEREDSPMLAPLLLVYSTGAPARERSARPPASAMSLMPASSILPAAISLRLPERQYTR